MENPEQPKVPDHLESGQKPVDLHPGSTDERNIELKKDDVDHFHDVLKLLGRINQYLKTPVYQLKQGEDYHNVFEQKGGDWQSDFNHAAWVDIPPLYAKTKPYIERLVLYYGRYIDPKPIEYRPEYPNMMTPYQGENYNNVGYRGVEMLLGNYAKVRDYVVKAIDRYYREDKSIKEIGDALTQNMANMTGRQFLLLLEEDRRRTDYQKQLETLY